MIIALSGTPDGKSRFINLLKSDSIKYKVEDVFGRIYKNLFDHYGIIYDDIPPDERGIVFSVLSRNLLGKIASEMDGEILILEGLTKELLDTAKDDYGAFSVRIIDRGHLENQLWFDQILYQEDSDFETKARDTIRILCK